jgi:hypothetical protein
MHDVMDGVGRRRVRRRTRRLGASALIDRDVDNDGAGFHGFDGVGGDQLGRRRTRDQDRPDHQIRPPAKRLDGIAGGEYRAHPRTELACDAAQHVGIAIDDGDRRSHAGGDQRGVAAGHSASEDQDIRRRHTRHAAEQHAAAAVFLLQAARADMRRHAARDLRHWREQRQGALGARHGLVGNRDDARCHQVGGLLRIGRQMQIGEQHLSGLESLAFRRERLLDLHDQLAARINLVGMGRDFGSHRLVIGIAEAGSQAGILFDQDPMTGPGELANRRGHETHAILAVLDFLRHADEHLRDPSLPPTRLQPANSTAQRDLWPPLRLSPLWLPRALLDFRHRVAFPNSVSQSDRSAT